MKIALRENTITVDIGYHVTPLDNISNIEKLGLIRKEYTNYIKGVKTNLLTKNYFWLEYDYAKWYATYHANHDSRSNPTDQVILKVNLKGITLHPDPEAENMTHYGAKDNKGSSSIYY